MAEDENNFIRPQTIEEAEIALEELKGGERMVLCSTDFKAPITRSSGRNLITAAEKMMHMGKVIMISRKTTNASGSTVYETIVIG